MVSDQEIARGVETLLRQTDPNAVTTLNGVVQQLEAKLGFDLSHKAGFIRDQINFLLRSHPQPHHTHLSKDHFTFQQTPQFPTAHPHQFLPHFALHPQPLPEIQHLRPPHTQLQTPPLLVQNAAVTDAVKPSAPAAAKRKGGSGGLNKVCGVSPELQTIVGEPALPRTEIVKQLWVYIRKHNLQDPSNKRKIICDDALRLVFETDSTDMFKMNKLLAKHITSLEPNKASGQAKRIKVEAEHTTDITERDSSPVIISEALAKFLGSSGREMAHSEAIRRVWDYIKVNHLEDPLNSMVIRCDAKLGELMGCESISALGVPEMLARHHLFKRS